MRDGELKRYLQERQDLYMRIESLGDRASAVKGHVVNSITAAETFSIAQLP